MQFVVAFLYHTTEEDMGEYFLAAKSLGESAFFGRESLSLNCKTFDTEVIHCYVCTQMFCSKGIIKEFRKVRNSAVGS